MTLRIILTAVLVALSGPVVAQSMVPSCYARTPGAPPVPRSARHVAVFIDQTTALDAELFATLRADVQRLMVPGTDFTVSSFSSFERGHYTQVVARGTIEAPVPAALRPTIGVPLLDRLDRCLHAQSGYAVRVAAAALLKAQGVPGTSFAHSEIMSSLKQAAAPLAASPARDKIVVIASDMIEHSSATSFYQQRGLRTIDPATEMRKAATAGLFADFAGARVFVIGAGLLPPESHDAGRTLQSRRALASFWSAWFRQSRGRLAGFGDPNLMTPIG